VLSLHEAKTTMSALSDFTKRLDQIITRAEQARTAVASMGGAGAAAGPASQAQDRALASAIRAETRARNAATKMLEAEAAEKRAGIPQLKAEARLSAYQTRTEEQQARAYQAAARLGIGRGPGTAAPTAGGMSIPISAGMAGLGIGAAVYAARRYTQESMRWATGAFNIAHRDDLTMGQKTQAISESLPGIGSVIKSLREFGQALDGTTERVRRENRAIDIARATLPIQFAGEREVRELRTKAMFGRAGADITAGLPIAAGVPQDYLTWRGQIAAHEHERMQPAQDAAVRALRDARLSRFQARALAGQRADAASALQGRIRYRDQAWAAREAYHGANPETLTRLRGDVVLANEAIGEASRTFEQADRAARQANVTAAEREAQARTALIDVMENQTKIEQARLQRMIGNAMRFGGAGPGERAQYEAAALYFQQHPEQWGQGATDLQNQLAALNPALAQQLSMQAGQGMPEYLRAQERGELESGTLAEQQGRVNAAAIGVRVAVQLNEEKLATDIAAALNADLRPLIREIEVRAQEEAQRIMAERLLQNRDPATQ
jgi:hypothetical protein